MHTQHSHSVGRGSQQQRQELRAQVRGRVGGWSRGTSLIPNRIDKEEDGQPQFYSPKTPQPRI